jgi:predicted GNAT family acetyltransferase/uncharacterized Fe-S cluster protein YjdI
VKKDFSNGELTIVWRPVKCIHSGICVKTLPKVYDPKAKPWIQPEHATTDQLVQQVDQCPSGALTYYFNQDVSSGFFSDNAEAKRYELHFEGHTAYIDYKKSKNKIYLIHTDVPAALEGRGMGSRIVLQALVNIRQRGLTLVPLCPFVAKYLKKHPHWNELVKKGTNTG